VTALPATAPQRRSTPLTARGEPMVWLTGVALAVCLLMITSLLGVVLYFGAAAFWPRPIERVTLAAPEGQTPAVFLGVPMREEAYDPPAPELASIKQRQAAGTLPPGALDDDGRPLRRLYRVGNRELGAPFRWVNVHDTVSFAPEPGSVLLERTDWGVWIGTPKAVIRQREVLLPGPAEQVPLTGTINEAGRDLPVERTVLGPVADGQVRVRERIRLASEADALAVFTDLLPAAAERREQIARLETREVGRINARIESERLRLRETELAHARAKQALRAGQIAADADRALRPGPVVWGLALLGALAAAVVAIRMLRTEVRLGAVPRAVVVRRNLTVTGLAVAAGLLGLFAALEHPFGRAAVDDAELARVTAEVNTEVTRLRGEYDELMARVASLREADGQWRVLVHDLATGRFAPQRQTEPDEPLRISQVIRIVPANDLSAPEKLGVYVARWREFAFGDPREANTEGGIFPVIFGTVTLTLLLSVAVVPLGVVAAIYLREYAKQGPLTSAIRIAVNNLAGVPSIVYGVFGLGFFCYTVGVFIDRGPSADSVLPAANWWPLAIMLGLLICAAVAFGLLARPIPGTHPSRAQRWLGSATGLAWFAAALGAIWLVTATPYFSGLFAAKESATFGTRGMLWSALTLALLTLPVVIVATEEAVAAVPRSMREGSYGCGASKWQTIQRIVLPRAMPGIMTGMILAMARGAGEVAPLMLTGAVKSASGLPISSEFPFFHLERSFMHLGFHIYDVGFQSPDSEAARPIVWCTTLLLILVVVTLNLTAIRIRSRLRRKFLGEAF
jgi:phosphate transport system permease protein